MTRPRNGFPELRQAWRSGMWLLVAVFLFSVFVNLLMLTGPLFMLQVYDRVLGSRSEETLVALFLLVGVLFALMGVLDFARGRILARVGARFQTMLDRRVFGAVMRHSLIPQFRAGPVAGPRDLEAIRTVFTSPAMPAFFDAPWTPLFIAAIFVFHPLLGGLAVAGGVFLVGVAALNNWLTRHGTAGAQAAARDAQDLADQARHSCEIVYAQGMNGTISARWQRFQGIALAQTVRTSDWTGLFASLTKAFRLFLQSAMLALGAWLVLNGEMTAGGMIAASILLGRGLAPVEQVIGQWALLQRAFAGWKALGAFLEATPPAPETLRLPKPTPSLTLRGVTVFAPGARQPTLSNISFSVTPGEAAAIIGKSGSGKSTLAKTLLGLIHPVAGELRLGGAALDQYDRDALGTFIGYLPQQVSLFAGTISENIARMCPDPDDSRVVDAAHRANAHEMILSLPDGYKTMVHAGGPLSGGQCQRIALARAFYGDPVLLILDEPNSALDGEGSEALNRAVRDFKRDGKAVIIMTHRPMAIAECDRLIVVENGRLKADGPRDEVLRTMVKNAGDLQNLVLRRSGA
ncbi:ATP-binding cassette subfamily C protein [Rhodovulum imhoffii]|uniref:ATP-binding cassette subfamily C protein n=1 Tax=Rhodovulum imhoffii TaxID=365340 RepID=A0A2T5BRY9_9RHOB|nr:type I secretion system permease/ATPase [Rhodovulum imhoffii]MBK5932774.1 type I secretion system permease/ATPase [Rhodovulum imhoffii]PTN02077.1 ATP-binding cassette subfamily C protein [Rhodovulum imhoffii]